MKAEEFYIKKFGVCPTIEKSIAMHSYNDMISFAASFADASPLNNTEELRERFEVWYRETITKDQKTIFNWFLQNIPVMGNKDGWVSPEIKLPEDNQKVLFMVSDTDMRKGSFLLKDQFNRPLMFCDGSFFVAERVLAWMPLPNSPK